jgi:rSAM/selenodomain-associated transferase 1
VDKTVEMVENNSLRNKLAGCRLGVFAKQPLPGQVKTRLTPPLSPAEAAALYEISLRETLERCCAAGLAPVLFYAGNRDYFRSTFPDVELVAQVPGDLGRRMTAAMARFFQEANCRGAVLIGSDSPDMPLTLLREAFSTLLDNASDCVIAPAADGGYVLIGLRHLWAELFTQVPWSSREVLAVTRIKAVNSGLRYQEISGWEDVDDLPSLQRLLKRSPQSQTARYAARCLRQLFPG